MITDRLGKSQEKYSELYSCCAVFAVARCGSVSGVGHVVMRSEMAEEESQDQAPEDIPSTGQQASIKRKATSKSPRVLNQEELAQSGVRVMLLDELDRLEGEVSKLAEYEDRYHETDKNLGIMAERLEKANAAELGYSISLSVGSGLLTLAPTLATDFARVVLFVFAALLLGGAIAFKTAFKTTSRKVQA